MIIYSIFLFVSFIGRFFLFHQRPDTKDTSDLRCCCLTHLFTLFLILGTVLCLGHPHLNQWKCMVHMKLRRKKGRRRDRTVNGEMQRVYVGKHLLQMGCWLSIRIRQMRHLHSWFAYACMCVWGSWPLFSWWGPCENKEGNKAPI